MTRYNLGEFQRAIRDNHDGWLTRDEKWTAFILASHGSTDGLNVHRSQELIALDTAISVSAVYRALKGLRDKGVIERTSPGNKRQGLSDVYRLNPPDMWGTDYRSHRPVKFTGQPDIPNTSLNVIELDTDHWSHRPVNDGGNLESSPALDVTSKAITCPDPKCKKPAPESEVELLSHLETYHPWLLKRVAARNPISSVPANAPGLHRPAPRKFNTWTCEQCGKVSSEMNSASKTMCNACARKIEGE